MGEIPTTCHSCGSAFAAADRYAGQAVACPFCGKPTMVPHGAGDDEFDPDAPPQILELQERPEDKGQGQRLRRPKPAPTPGGVRGKLGFGRAVVGPGMRHKKFSAPNPMERAHRRHNLTLFVGFGLMGASVLVAAFFLFKGAKPVDDRLTQIEREGDRFAKAYAAMDAAALAGWHKDPEQRAAVAAYYQGAFSRFQIRLLKYGVFPEWEGSHLKIKALVRFEWTIEYLDRSTGQREVRQEKRRMHWELDPVQGWKTRSIMNLPMDLYPTPPP